MLICMFVGSEEEVGMYRKPTHACGEKQTISEKTLSWNETQIYCYINNDQLWQHYYKPNQDKARTHLAFKYSKESPTDANKSR